VKEHLKIQLREGTDIVALTGPALPHWQDAIADKSAVGGKLHPSIDALLREYNLPVWVTSEYWPAGREWSEHETRSGLHRIYRLIVREDRQIPPELVEKIRGLEIVERAEVGQVAEAELPEPISQSMGAPVANQRSRDAILLPEAHGITRGRSDVVVAVLDTGVSREHPELKDALLPGFDFVNIIRGADEFIGDRIDADPDPEDEAGHGTHVAGIIVGRGISMPAGVAPGCRVLPVRVLGTVRRDGKRIGAGLIDNINSGVKWAVDQGAEVINMSLGVRHERGGLPHEEVVQYARRKGVTIVAASGNDGQAQLYYPGALDGVIAVGSADDSGRVSEFSTYHRRVQVIAPGDQIYSSYLDNGYAFSSGTSQAAPFVAGVVALLKSYARQQGRRLEPAQISYILRHSSDRVGRRFRDARGGFGRVNARDALRLLQHKLSAAGRGLAARPTPRERLMAYAR
jgi:thermitase